MISSKGNAGPAIRLVMFPLMLIMWVGGQIGRVGVDIQTTYNALGVALQLFSISDDQLRLRQFLTYRSITLSTSLQETGHWFKTSENLNYQPCDQSSDSSRVCRLYSH